MNYSNIYRANVEHHAMRLVVFVMAMRSLGGIRHTPLALGLEYAGELIALDAAIENETAAHHNGETLFVSTREGAIYNAVIKLTALRAK